MSEDLEVNVFYNQFYVVDIGLNPDAPEMWTESDVAARFNRANGIVALSPESDGCFTMRIISPLESGDVESDYDFKVSTSIEVSSGRLAICEWPRNIRLEYTVEPGFFTIQFAGYKTASLDVSEHRYTVRLSRGE